MGGQKFQYDESGSTFFYFLLSFLALLLIPGTYYCWPRKRKEDPDKLSKECLCDGCRKKRRLLQVNEQWKGTKEIAIKLLIIGGWIILALLAYKVSQFDYEYANFDPYEILGVSTAVTQKEIRKAYHRLSLVLHPDKPTGDEKAFMKVRKAYQALTDEEARSNWEKYGNPDGPYAMTFGIALPSWIVEKRNIVWVLGLYAVVIMVALPTAVGIWWYRSMRYSGEQVLLETIRLYYFLLHSPSMIPLKRCIMILGSSLEFEKKYDNEIIERVSDQVEVPQLIKQLPNLNEKLKTPPLNFVYSIKARALLHAHFSRLKLNPDTLDRDRMIVTKKCPYLIQEMVRCAEQLIYLAYTKRVPEVMNIRSLENIMKMSPMVVQALWDTSSVFLQLPHIKEEHIKYFVAKKRHLKSIQQFAQMDDKERRSVVRFLNDEQYCDVLKVMGKMPYVKFNVKSEVIDDEAHTVYTAGATVTVTVTLQRQDMSVLMNKPESEVPDLSINQPGVDTVEDEEKPKEKEEEKADEKVSAKKPVWMKQQRKTKKGASKKGFKPKSNAPKTDKPEKSEKSEALKNGSLAKGGSTKTAEEKAKLNAGEEGGDSSENEGDRSDREDEEEQPLEPKENAEDEADDWDRFQSPQTKRERVLEGRSRMSHPVHCPYLPDEKQEFWWVYISDRKSSTLLTPASHVTALVDKEEVQLRFTAPRWPGFYTFTLCLRSDSYLGFDQMHDIKLDVKEAPAVPTEHPQWEMSEEEDEQDDDTGHVSEYTTDEDVEDD